MRTDDRQPWHGRIERRTAATCALALVAAALATGLRYALDPILGDTAQYITFYVAAMLVAAAGGLVPGLLTTGLGVLLSMWLFVQPRGGLSVGSRADLVRLVAFLTVGVGVSLIAERVHFHRRRAEARTAELHEMLELVDLGHLLMRGIDDRIIRWTAGCERLYGYTAGEAIGRVSSELLQTEYSVPVAQIHQQLHERGRWEGELVHRHKDGRRVTVASLWLLHRDRTGRPAAILESNNNISGLRRTEERLRLVLEAARIGTWDWDLRSGALEWSQQCKELFGLPPQTPMSFERFLEAVHPEDRQRVEQSARAAVEQKTEYDVELRAVWPDGNMHWIAFHGKGYFDGSGRPYRLAGAAMDITERKAMEEKIWSIAQFPEESRSPVLRLGGEGTVLYANRAAATFLADMRASAEERCPPVLQAAMEQALRTGREQELEVTCTKGRTFSFSCVPVPERRYANLYGRDVTEARRAEEALRDSERRYSALFANAIYGIAHCRAITDEHGRPIDYEILQVNEAYERITGIKKADIEGRRARRVFPGIEDLPFDYIGTYGRIALEGGEIKFEDFFAPLGQWLSIYAYSPKRGEFAAIFTDVTAQKIVEEELRAAKQAAEDASRAKDHFLAVLSHELRTPLTPVLTAVSMLQDDARWDEGVRHTLDMVRRNVELEAQLIDDLLDVTRIARGKIELEKKPVPLCEVIGRAVEVCKPDIEARRLHFGVDLGPGAPYLVHADTARLQQVFWNLLKNAIKFTPHGGCVGVRCHLDDHTVIAEVNDSGIGIEPGELPRLFTAFEHQRSTTRPFGGLGLGLAIARAIVEMHGGTIEVHSEGRHKGATFRVRLPILEAAVAESKPPATPAARSAPGRPVRILLVEDHGDTADVMRLFLTMQGHDVTVAGDVATAMEEAGRNSFDLLISDLGLPDGNGTDLMRALRARGDAMPGIALSGYGQERDIQRSREVGFSAHLTKPASPDRLAEVIAKVIEDSSMPPDGRSSR